MKTFFTRCFCAIILFTTFTSCETNSCSACTDDYRMKIISIKDQNGNPISLDDFKVINTDTNQEIDFNITANEIAEFKANGEYPLMDDLNIEASQTLQLQFQGFKEGVQVITENYIVSADCCGHVDSVDGNQNIVLSI